MAGDVCNLRVEKERNLVLLRGTDKTIGSPAGLQIYIINFLLLVFLGHLLDLLSLFVCNSRTFRGVRISACTWDLFGMGG